MLTCLMPQKEICIPLLLDAQNLSVLCLLFPYINLYLKYVC